MKRLHLFFHPESVKEAREARLWYQARSPQAGRAFAQELKAAFGDIRSAPFRWPSGKFGMRRRRLHRFPFSVLYLEIHGALWIVAVAHGHRHPGYWMKRRLDL